MPGAPLTDPGGRFPRTGLFVWTRSLRSQEGLPVLGRHSYGSGCLCVLRPRVGSFSRVGALALPRDTMGQSDSWRARWHFLSLRHPSCLALVVRAAGTLRVSSVPCVCFGMCHALRPRQAFDALTCDGRLSVGYRYAETVPACIGSFEAELLKREATPACGSRLSLGTLLDGRSRRKYSKSGAPSAKQPSVLGCWLDFSIRYSRFEPWKLVSKLEGLSPSLTHVFSERTSVSAFQRLHVSISVLCLWDAFGSSHGTSQTCKIPR